MDILHGDHIVHSRAALGTYIDTARENNVTIERLVAKKLTRSELEEALVSTSLFATAKLVIIEELHSLPKSKRKDELIALVAEHAAQPATPGETIILWESRSLTPTMVKKFAKARVQEFKLSKKLFSWLDSLGTPNVKQKLLLAQEAIATEGEYLCFSMLVRQVRLLIQAKDGGTIKGAPFMITKLQSQARRFTLESLLKTHAQLLELDRQMKQSGSILSMTQQLDLVTLAM